MPQISPLRCHFGHLQPFRGLLTALLFCLLQAGGVVHAQVQLPPNMYPDSIHFPFVYGVASFEPQPDGILLWTRAEDPGGQPLDLSWELALDPGMSQVVSSGSVQATPQRDWTVTVPVTGLLPRQTYWYRFSSAGGGQSVVGRTRTAASGQADNLRLAIFSCSSIYSGFFNAYARIGERDDLDLVVHLGDYIYDFVDADEAVRVPVPAPVDPQNLAEWRERHRYYLLDPDLRLARQMHPWIAIWDNHDVDADTPGAFAEAVQAFQEYLPMRLVDSLQPELIYRRIAYGDLLDIHLLDTETLRDRDTLPGGAPGLLGDAQWAWLQSSLQASTARWHLVGNQKMVAEFSLAGLPAFIPFGDGPVADSGAWDGYAGERNRLLNFLDAQGIDNVIMASGDIHMSFATDLAADPGQYDANTGAGSHAVEFLPGSITRGNFDEAGYGGWIADLAAAAMSLANPHHIYAELESHGYGILDVRADSCVAEFWYSDILSTTSSEQFAGGYVVRNGANHWDRTATASPTVDRPAAAQLPATMSLLYPNPAHDLVHIQLDLPVSGHYTIALIEAGTGRPARMVHSGKLPAGSHTLEAPLGRVPAGAYLIRVSKDGAPILSERLIVQH